MDIEAQDTPEGDTTTTGVNVGVGLNVAGSFSETTVSPAVSSFIGGGSTVHATGSFVILATSQKAANVPTYSVTTANTTTGQLEVDNHGLKSGDTIVYDPGTNSSIVDRSATGADAKTFGVIRTDDNHVLFGASFYGGPKDAQHTTTWVDSATDTIQFAAPHHFLPGDAVRFASADGGTASVGGLTTNTTYYVRVIDDRTIKLTTTRADAVTPQNTQKAFASTAVGSDGQTITLANHGFTDGQSVTYHAPPATTFSSALVNAATVQVSGQTTVETDSTGQIVDHPTNNNVVILNHGFVTGDKVVYQVAAGGSASRRPDGRQDVLGPEDRQQLVPVAEHRDGGG